MTKNTQDQNKVTIVHIFTSSSPTPALPYREGEVQTNNLTLHNNTVNSIENNAVFLNSHNVEYIILDNTNSDFLIKNISSLPSFQTEKLIYLKKEFSSLKQALLTGAQMATHNNIYYVKNEQIINLENIDSIERLNPLLRITDTEFFIQNVPENFKWEKFNLYMKKNKNVLDKMKLLF